MDLIEQDLLDQPRDIVKVHMYLAPDENPAEILPLFKERLEASGVEYKLETSGIEQEDWQNAWKKYYHAMDIGQHLAIVPGWETYDTDRIVITMDPGMAFGTGTHETTSLCLETLDSMVKGGERVLDIGTGSGILAIAALKLGAAEAEGVDIDPMCVRTAGENAERNGVAEHFTVLVGDLSDKASGKYNIITANIVAAAILSLAPHVPVLMAPGARFIASGIIDTRKDEVLAAMQNGTLDCVTFGSSSTVENFLSLIPADELRAHVLERILELDLLCDGNTVVGYQRCAELLIEHDVAALGAEGDLNRICKLIHAALNSLACFFAENNLFCHDVSASLFYDSENVALTDDGVFRLIELYLAAAVLADENLFANLNFHFNFVAVNYAAGADLDDFIYLGLFLRRCRKEDTALGLFLGFRLHEHYSVCQRLEFHHIYLQLNNIQTKKFDRVSTLSF